jgi:hypothetical protein
MRKIILLPLLALGLSACVDNRTSIEVTGRAAASDAKLCKFAPGGDRLFGAGTFDVTLPLSYSIALYVQNNLVDPTSLPSGATKGSNDWHAESVRVRLNPKEYVDLYGPSPALAPVTGENVLEVASQATAAAGGSTVQIADLLSAALAERLVAVAPASGQVRVALGITLQGRTGDGKRLDAGEWFFPLDVCMGCLNVTPTCPAGTTLALNGCSPIAQIGVPFCQ